MNQSKEKINRLKISRPSLSDEDETDWREKITKFLDIGFVFASAPVSYFGASLHGVENSKTAFFSQIITALLDRVVLNEISEPIYEAIMEKKDIENHLDVAFSYVIKSFVYSMVAQVIVMIASAKDPKSIHFGYDNFYSDFISSFILRMGLFTYVSEKEEIYFPKETKSWWDNVKNYFNSLLVWESQLAERFAVIPTLKLLNGHLVGMDYSQSDFIARYLGGAFDAVFVKNIFNVLNIATPDEVEESTLPLLWHSFLTTLITEIIDYLLDRILRDAPYAFPTIIFDIEVQYLYDLVRITLGTKK